MISRNFRLFAAAALLGGGLPSLPAVAQTAPAASAAITAGMKVVDDKGGEVGTVVEVKGDTVTVRTDKHQAAFARSSFTLAQGKLLFGMTRQQLNEAVERSLAEAQAKLVPGATVTGSQGAVVATIDAIDDSFATLKLLSGKLIRIPRPSLGAGPNGGVLGLTAQELEARVTTPSAS